MAYNQYGSYNPYGGYGYNPYPAPQFQPQMQQQQPVQQIQQVQQTPQPQSMNPVIHADIIQIKSLPEGENWAMGVGTQMFQLADDSAIAIKQVFSNGEYSFDVYDKRPPAPVKPQFDPSAYVTRDELETRIEELLARQNEAAKARRQAKESEA